MLPIQAGGLEGPGQPRSDSSASHHTFFPALRTAPHWWKASGVEARSLLKLYGIRFDILVTGQAGKFGLIPTIITLGTGAAWLGVITFFCDLLLLYVDEEAHFYWSTKYEEVSCGPVRALGSATLWRIMTRALI